MKTLGILGGIGPESTIDYYKLLLEIHREKNPDAGNPPMVILSMNFYRLAEFMPTEDWDGLAEFLIGETKRLKSAGADFGIIAANTPHIAFDMIAPRSAVPLVSIVEATAKQAHQLGLRRVGLLGTQITMNGEFYPNVFSRSGIEIVVPGDADKEYVNEKYFAELFHGVLLDETRQGLLAVADRLIDDQGAEGIILGGTELPLILRADAHRGVPLLDTTRIHAERAVDEMLK